MNLRSAHLALVSVLTIPFLLSACGSDDSTGPGGGSTPADFSGTWTVTREVISKRVCDQPVGTQFGDQFRIAQDGSSASLWYGGAAIALTVRGSRATGSGTTARDVPTEFDLTIEEGQLGGTVTSTLATCTEVTSVSGSVSSTVPSAGWARNWDLETEVISTSCKGETFGEMESLCRRIVVNGSTVSIEDPEGNITGVGDGDTAFLWATVENERLELSLNLTGNTLSGQIFVIDDEDFCSTTLSIMGTARSEACPPPPDPADFVGDWFVDFNSFRNSGCPDQEAEEFIGRCISVTAQGSNLTVDDGTGLGLLTGSIVDDAAEVSRTDFDGTYTLRLERDGDELHAEGEKRFPNSKCFDSYIEVDYNGIPLGVSCDTPSSGAFSGAWLFSTQIVETTCKGLFPVVVGCSEFFQAGNTVLIENGGLRGIVSGNTLTVMEVEENEFGPGSFTLEITLQLSGDGNSVTGTQIFRVEGTDSDDCEATLDIQGTRTTDCIPEFSSSSGWNLKEF